MRDRLVPDGVLLVVQGEDNRGGILEMINGGVGGEELVPDEENEV